MSVRASMIWLINFLRLKINDEGANTLDSDQYYVGDSIKLTCEYTDLEGVPADPESPTVTVLDPTGEIIVNNASPIEPGVIGVRYYIFKIPKTGPEGIWRAEFSGSIDDNESRYPIEFEVALSKRIWTDEELQSLLDLHRIHIRRELLNKGADEKTYYSKYGMLEDDVSLWTGSTSGSMLVTPNNSNLVDGTFTFNTVQSGNYYLDGKSYDIHSTMAECMEQLAMDHNRARIWERGGVKYTQYDYFEMAKYHRSLTEIKGIKVVRSYS
jgi:hypothetical protein